MRAAYPEWDYKGRDVVAMAATKLYGARQKPSRLSPYIFMTDPERVENIEATAEQLPRGAALFYRHFGKVGHRAQAKRLRQLTFENSLQFLIGDDPELAIATGADGVHFRRDVNVAAPKLWRKRCPAWIISMAGIKSGPYKGDVSILDGLLVSSVFPSRSPSAGKPIGIEALSEIACALPAPIFALGGVNKETAPKLIGSGAAGFAGIGFGL
ncbi:MAG: thiamine phosphate synthase [Hellea sp.]